MPIIYPVNVKAIASILKNAGFSCYAVGGCVRDSIMGRKPNDWDVATSARPEEMLSVFNAAGVRTIPTGLKHGTVTLLIDGETYECTSFRIDGSYTDARHPDAVTFTEDISEDLRRRDFTVNAMAGDPLCEGGDDVIDLFGGRNDIASRLIRCVGDAETRFSEDVLRILRAVRFATVLDFDIEENTKNAAIKLRDTLAAVSIERRVVELKKYC
jgi:tRNA nucleotidyltransferase (CCA-adding enzyme)